jgi:glutamyl-tRNA reductase
MRISLIGAGRVAHHLAKALMSQHEIINIYSRSFDKAADLAQVAHAKAVSHFFTLYHRQTIALT